MYKRQGVEGARYPLLKLNRNSMAVLEGSESVQITKPTVEVKVNAREGSAVYESDDIYKSKFKSETRTKSTSTFKSSKLKPKTKTKLEFKSKSKQLVSKTSSGKDPELFERLRILRKIVADNANLPPYIIFADTSLHQMVSMRPKTSAEFLKISGVGEYKLKKYGRTFLAEIADYCESGGAL